MVDLDFELPTSPRKYPNFTIRWITTGFIQQDGMMQVWFSCTALLITVHGFDSSVFPSTRQRASLGSSASLRVHDLREDWQISILSTP